MLFFWDFPNSALKKGFIKVSPTLFFCIFESDTLLKNLKHRNMTDELTRTVKKTFKGVEVEYQEVYYLDFHVDEDTGMIDRTKKERFYKKEQANRNMRALKNAYLER